MHNLLFDMVLKKDKPGLDAVKLGAALAIIRYNQGYKAVQTIFQSFCQSDPFLRMKEAFRLFDNRRIMTSKYAIPWKDTFAEEEMRKAKLEQQIAEYGSGYSHGKYSRSVFVDEDEDEDVDVSDGQEDSDYDD